MPDNPLVDKVVAEEWRPVVGYEGYYEVSDQGRVRSLGRVMRYGNQKYPNRQRFVRGRFMTRTPNVRGGHLYVSLMVEGQIKSKAVHVLVAEAFLGPRPEGLQVRHINGVPADCRLSNLAWGTQSENMADRVRHGVHHQANKTHCPQGHEYTPENTIIVHRRNGSPFRRCRTCSRAATQKWYQKRSKANG